MSHLHVPFDDTLDSYRKRSLFDVEELSKFLFSEDAIKLQRDLHEEIQNYPVLRATNGLQPSVEEQKRLLVQKSFAAYSIKLKFMDLFTKPYFPLGWVRVIDQLSKGVGVQSGVSFSMFPAALNFLGTEKHSQFHKDNISGKILGSFCLTEVGHGSNTKNIKTSATYDKHTKEFIIHSPDFQAAKCWIANMGKLATHAIVYAQLITSDNKTQGLHAFVVPIRDSKTFLPFPGVIVGDLGEKLGLLGVDNGFVMFNQYRIPKMNLLDKLGYVTDDGEYVVNIIDVNEQYANSFRVLTSGRLSIMIGCTMVQIYALTIALRYAAVRRQFGPNKSKEWPILEYQSHQYRLLPYLASTYTNLLFLNYLVIQKKPLTLTDHQEITELHGLMSAGKPYFSFLSRDAIQECREACAGLGYLSVSGFDEIKNDNDATVTFEGDNNVLLQQTSNWLLKFWPLIISKKLVKSPLTSLNFLNDALSILQLKFTFVPVEEFHKPQNVNKYYQWLVCYLLKRSYEKCKFLEKNTNDELFWVKNNSQIFYLRNLSIAYFESFVLQQACLMVESSPNAAIKNVLEKLVSLYAVWSLQKHVSFIYEGHYTDDPLFCKRIEDSILWLCNDIKNEAVSLVDVVAPLDDTLRSILAHSDGQVYSKLLNAIMQIPEAFSNATWLKHPNSKL